MAAVADRHIGDIGTGEADWAPWLAGVAPLVLDDLLPPGARLVVVSPHPDDELIACGGLLQWHAARGGRLALVAVTDGEASHAGSATWSAPRLAARRRDESAQGVLALNLPEQPQSWRLGLPDGGVAGCAGVLQQALGALLAPGDVVVATWQLDGHPDHDAVGAASAAACADAGVPLWQAPVWMWHWSRPADPRVPWHRLRALPLDAAQRSRKLQALAAHATQLSPRSADLGPVLGPLIVERVGRAFEYFFV